MSQFIRDVSTLGFAISLCILTVLALAVSCITLASLALVSMPLVLLATPTLITALCLYSVYQCMYPTVPALVYGPSPLTEDEQWHLFYSQLEYTTTQDDTSIHEDTTPVCSITYALLATTGTTDETYLAPVHVTTLPSPATITAQDIDDAIAEGSIAPMSTVGQEYATYLSTLMVEELVTLARQVGVRGASSRWKKDTIISRILTAQTAVAA